MEVPRFICPPHAPPYGAAGLIFAVVAVIWLALASAMVVGVWAIAVWLIRAVF